ncbi:MAG: tetratricopeptide repeat protein [Candidatus Bipolaricaulis anaerobius]|nr:tetratricopeptide repeat protein [Candidatus Bipolaricaulis anaerobius]
MARHQDGEGTDLAPLPDPTGLTPAARAEVVQDALARAEELRCAGRYEEGIALLMDALRYGEVKAQVLFRLGNLYFASGDLTRAEHAYLRATEEDPHHASAHHNLGVVYRRQGKISQSVKMLKKAQHLDVRYPRAGEVTLPEKAILRRWARPAIAVPLVLLVLLILAMWLAGRS